MDDEPFAGRGAIDAVVGDSLTSQTSFAAAVADTLAWAVRHGMPLPSAVRGLAAPNLAMFLTFRLPGDVWFLPIPGATWRARARLGAFVALLEKGFSLGDTMHRCLSPYLPGFYIEGVRRAEKDGTLAETLGVLARHVRHPLSVSHALRQEFRGVLLRMLVALYVLGFTLVRLVPQLHQIFEELELAEEALSAEILFRLHPALLALVSSLIGILAIVAVVSKWGGQLELLIRPLPVFGMLWRRLMMTQLAEGIAAHLRIGGDLVEAVAFSGNATASPWIRRRAERFQAHLVSGLHWLDAWAAAFPGNRLEKWVLENAASREDAPGGFETLADLHRARVGSTIKRIRRWVDPAATLVLAAFVLAMAHYCFGSVTKLIWAMSQ